MTPTSTWDPAQYEIFKRERAQPFHELLARVQKRADMRVVDLGCGPGELTAALTRTLGARETIGLDNSDTMLARARAHATGGMRFESADIGLWEDPGAFDLVFSNAALHWVPDHDAVFERLASSLAPGGQLAIQMPANFDHPSSALATELAGEAPYRGALGGRLRGGNVDPLERYAERLYALGFETQHVHMRAYLHEMPGPEAVYQWTHGSTLTWYASELGAELFESFASTYRERLLATLGDTRPYAFTFKRILIWGGL